MQRGKWPAIIAAGALLIAFVAWPYVTAYRLKAAVKSGDTAALADLIEFPTLRQGLKEQLNAAMLARLAAEPGGDGGLLAGLGLALAGTFIDKAVDAYVTPAGVARLVAGDPLELQAGDRSAAGEAAADGPGAEPAREPFAGAKMAYESFDRFVVTVPGEAGKANRFVLRRRGLGWKLTDILVPLD